LKDSGNIVVLYFANSNIDTREEYEKRFEAARTLARVDGVELVAEEYNHEDWLREVANGSENEPEKGFRCERCYRYNLERTLAYLEKNGYDAFCTSLTVSPHKPSAKIFAATDDPRFLKEDFKKKEGYKRSIELSKKHNLYRQNYCGCVYSKRDTPT
jgi:predicted adenine nucleotide alpha hydrolase (AANH) superfamily ATPase